MDALASLDIPTFLEEGAKRAANGENHAMNELIAALSSPAHHLNYLLSSEIFFQERVLKKVLNQIGEEFPDEFQIEGAFMELYKSASANLKASPALEPFQSTGLSLPKDIGWKDAVEEVETVMADYDSRLVEESKLPLEVRKELRKARAEDTQPSFQLTVAGSTRQLEDDIDCITAGVAGNHETVMHFKRGKVHIHNRLLTSVDITLHLRNVLTGIASKGGGKKRANDMVDDD